MSGESILGKVKGLVSTQALLAGAFATGITVFVSDAEAGAGSIGAAALAVGGPTIIGALIANKIMPTSDGYSPMSDLKRGALAGVGAVGFLMAIGQLPVQFDVQLLGTVGLVGVSTVIGDILGVYMTM